MTSRAKTRTPHSELVFRLSPNNNIGESYKKFGIADTTTTLIAVKLPLSPSTSSVGQQGSYEKDESITNESVSKHLGSAVQGTSVEIGEAGEVLGMSCDVDKVRKVYKLGGGDSGKKGKKAGGLDGDVDAERRLAEKKDIESVVLGVIALKGS
jgi:EKC/KEOPS complex subunit CGI121/TPRKB